MAAPGSEPGNDVHGTGHLGHPDRAGRNGGGGSLADGYADQLTWYSGRRRATLDWSEVTHVRFDTRLDFSVRATVLLTGGRKVRLPYESTPPDKLMEAALNAHGISTERHHFSLIG
jgi:hypothetical protein